MDVTNFAEHEEEQRDIFDRSNSSLRVISLDEILRDPGIRIRRARFDCITIKDYLSLLQEPQRSQYLAFHEAHPYYNQVCAGAKHHHWWIGGLADHVCEMIGVGLDLFSLYKGDLEGKVSRDDIIIACYLHDFAKIWTYELIEDRDREKNPYKYHPMQLFKVVDGAFNILDEESKTLLHLTRAGIIPTDRQWSAVLFCEGGWADASFGAAGRSRTTNTVTHDNPLVVLTNMVDLYSSQILGRSIA